MFTESSQNINKTNSFNRFYYKPGIILRIRRPTQAYEIHNKTFVNVRTLRLSRQYKGRIKLPTLSEHLGINLNAIENRMITGNKKENLKHRKSGLSKKETCREIENQSENRVYCKNIEKEKCKSDIDDFNLDVISESSNNQKMSKIFSFETNSIDVNENKNNNYKTIAKKTNVNHNIDNKHKIENTKRSWISRIFFCF